MIINLQTLESLLACNSGYKNFARNHPNFNGTLAESLALESVPYTDKIWLINKVVSKPTKESWIKNCLLSLIESYTTQQLSDMNILNCIVQINKHITSSDSATKDLAIQTAESITHHVASLHPSQQTTNLTLLINLL
jgi:hypothetical protein